MTHCYPRPPMRWNGAIGVIERCKRVSTVCVPKSRSKQELRSICGEKPKAKGVSRPFKPYMKRVQDDSNPVPLLQSKAMYAIRTEVMVVPGKTRAWEACWAQLSSLTKAQHGFQTGTLMNSLSYPAKYVLLMLWESREARQAWAKGEAFSAFVQANPPQALVTPGRPQEAYDVLFRVTGEGQPAYAGLGDWTLDT